MTGLIDPVHDRDGSGRAQQRARAARRSEDHGAGSRRCGRDVPSSEVADEALILEHRLPAATLTGTGVLGLARPGAASRPGLVCTLAVRRIDQQTASSA